MPISFHASMTVLKQIMFAMMNFHIILFRINPNFTDALQKLSSVLTATRNYDEAESLMKRVLDIKPDSSDVLNNYAVLLKTMSEYNSKHIFSHHSIKVMTLFQCNKYIRSHN